MITAAQFLRVVGALVRLNFSTGKDRACVRAHLRRCLYTVDSLKRLTHTLTHTRKRADGSSGNMGAKEYFSPSGNDQKRPENDIFRIFLLFVISRSGVRIRLPAPPSKDACSIPLSAEAKSSISAIAFLLFILKPLRWVSK